MCFLFSFCSLTCIVPSWCSSFYFALKFQLLIQFKTCLDAVLCSVIHDVLVLGSVCSRIFFFFCSGDPFGFWVVVWFLFQLGSLKKFHFCCLHSFAYGFLFVFLFTGFRFDRDWKKIEAFVGSKTVIQVFLD